ncbi:MAG TPA: anti-sigma factor antagonist [Actinophytocola sp.]|uniref:anti-sigma factor antagonist n=1 Tax=Actinophytocola sp. TaxID=1872138 RepID=UPI002DDD5F72|nr:anti-sigma factor antagonist [Actinophytocola sp.]HEV2779984.1 anti-sigma factor antagonist [Actinophytocola sp.]
MERVLLDLAQEMVGDAVVVRAAGEIDLVSAPEFRSHLERACAHATPPEHVVADLTGVSFLGSAGLSVLLDIDERCRNRHTPLRVVATSPGTVRPLQVTGLDRVLNVVASLTEVPRPR